MAGPDMALGAAFVGTAVGLVLRRRPRSRDAGKVTYSAAPLVR